MKRSKVLNSVARKYMLGYLIVGLFALAFLVISTLGNAYVSNRYASAISGLVAVNELAGAVDDLNGSVNLTYLYLSTTGLETYEANREAVEQHLQETARELDQGFIREQMDANSTVETYVKKSDALMEKLQTYLGSVDSGDYDAMESRYNELQDIYYYISLRFQDTYAVKLKQLSELEKRLNFLQRGIIAAQISLMILAVLGCFVYLYRVIREVSHSITVMRQGVDAIREDIFEAEPIEIHSNDEFEEFAGAFNDMTGIIQTQMQQIEENANITERLAEMEKENLRMFSDQQKSHLDFLQARVNPHFLFNTLNMISSLARLENADKCAELMEITASFLRYNLDNISKTVTLRKEIENLREYVAIQEYRYAGRYLYYFDVDDACLDFKMPCMILQPLVENTIKHGLAMKLEDGCVWVRVYREADRVCLAVTDNGIGMTEQQIQYIYEDFQENVLSGNNHIGLHNIYRRLQLFYHDDVSFRLQNMEPGLRTIISLPWEG